MELRRLEYFLVLAQKRHYGKAAEALHISQPGLSQQIKVLEQEIGTPLIRRGSHGITLTAAGDELREQGALLLSQVRHCIDRVRAVANNPTGLLRLAYTRSGPDLGMHDLVRRFREHYPDVTVELSTAWTSRNVEQLEAGDIDLAFIRQDMHTSQIDSLVVATEELVVALPEDHNLSSSTRIERDDVIDEPLVHWPRTQGPGYYDRIKQQIWLARSQNVVSEQPEAEHIFNEVANGVGIAILDQHRAAKLCPQGVCLRRFVDPVPTTEIAIAWLTETENPLVHRFVGLCRTETEHASS